MQLQPVVMNAFSQDPALAVTSSQIQSSANASGSSGGSGFLQILEAMEGIAKAQDKRIADDLKVQAKSRSSTAKMLSLLQLQYDLDDMQVSATMAKNIANQFAQAMTTLTQRT